MKSFLNKIKKFIPRRLLNFYQHLISFIFAVFYKFPSKNIIVIGVTGTKGKTTSAYLTYFLFQKLGFKTALSSSEYIAYGEEVKENPARITMPGRGFLQKFLKNAIEKNCEIAVIECTSEGLWQNRHSFIDFDIALFLGIHPEHIEHHGSYENYVKSKGKLFKALEKSFLKSKERKKLKGIPVKKTIIVNYDDFESDYFLSFMAEQKITFSLENIQKSSNNHLAPEKFKITSKGINFVLEGTEFFSPLLGKFNLYNILGVFCIFKSLNIPLKSLTEPLKEFKGIPGRMEIIPAKGFKVIIDYAHTPNSIEEVYKTVINLYKPKRMLCLISSAGGIRDKWKRPVIGEIAAKYCSYVIITNEDPMGEEPMEIIKAIEIGARKYLTEFEIEKPIEIIPDRKEAIFRLIEIANKGDVVITIGKGNEKSIDFGNEKIPWNEKEVVESALERFNKKIKSRKNFN